MDNKIIDISSLADIQFMDPGKTRFYILNSGFLGLQYDEVDKGRVILFRALPHKLPDEFISVCDTEQKEIGIIRNIADFKPEQAQLIADELNLRYYCLTIKSIVSIKDKMGYLYFNSTTNAGEKIFAVKDVSKSLIKIGENTLLIIDVDGNRYIIEDMNAFDRKSMRRLQPFLL